MYDFPALALRSGVNVAHLLYYVGATAIVVAGIIIAASAFIAIYMNIKNGKAQSAEQDATDARAADASVTGASVIGGSFADDTNNHNDVDAKEVEEQ